MSISKFCLPKNGPIWHSRFSARPRPKFFGGSTKLSKWAWLLFFLIYRLIFFGIFYSQCIHVVIEFYLLHWIPNLFLIKIRLICYLKKNKLFFICFFMGYITSRNYYTFNNNSSCFQFLTLFPNFRIWHPTTSSSFCIWTKDISYFIVSFGNNCINNG